MRALIVVTSVVGVAGFVKCATSVGESCICRVERVVKCGVQGGLMWTSKSADCRNVRRGREFVLRSEMTESCVMPRGVNVAIKVARLEGWERVSQM